MVLIEFVILIITLVILFIGWIIILFFIIESKPRSYESITGLNRVLIQCPTSQCATNVFNGEKRCPPTGQQIASNAEYEVCSSPYSCDNGVLPFAVMSDGSTNPLGVCPDDVQCRCVRNPSCPRYIVSAFQTLSGNPYVSLTGQKTTFSQFASPDNTQITYPNTKQVFCTIPPEWILRSTPGCTFTKFISTDLITECMGSPLGCNGQTFNPCLQGTLAYITDDVQNFDETKVEIIPLGCVPGNPCPCGQVAVFDTNSETLLCRSTYGLGVYSP